jgi:hypothetical protein
MDDKFVPVYRIVWVSAVPHFCGEEDCEREGQYEVRLELDESVWATNQVERDQVLRALENWQGNGQPPDPSNDDDE